MTLTWLSSKHTVRDKKRYQQTAIPLRLVLVVPFVLLTVGTVGLVQYLSLRNQQQSVQQLAQQLMGEVSDRVNLYLSHYLETPQQVNRLNASAIRLGEIDRTDPKRLERHFLQQIQEFDALSRIHFSNPQGGYLSVGNDQRGLTVAATDRFVSGKLRVHSVDQTGRRTHLLVERQQYDARDRPFFQRAVVVGQPTWTPVYVYLPASLGLGIAASYPLYNQAHQLEGVLASDLTLVALNQYLKNLKIGAHGTVFIIERSGLLIASSTPETPFFTRVDRTQPHRLPAIESKEPLIRLTAQHLVSQFGAFTKIDTTRQLHFKAANKRQFLQVTPFRDRFGLDWLVVVTVPESDFTGFSDANTQTAILLSAGALFGAIALGLLTAQWIVQPIQRLSRASRALAQGEWNETLKEDSAIAELQELTRSFDQTAEQLQRSFDHVRAALQASEERFTKVFRVSPDPIAIATPEGRYLEINDAFTSLFGYAREAVLGRTVAEVGLWLNSDEQERSVEQILAGEGVHNLECTFRSHAGELLTVLFSAESIEIQGQRCIIAMAKEITDRKQVEAALRQSEAALRRAQQVAHVGSWNLDLITGQVTWSEESFHIFGWDITQPEPTLSQFMALLHPDDRDVLQQCVTQAMTTGSSYSVDFRAIQPDGSIRYVEAKGEAIVNPNGQITQLIGTNLDITKHKQAELALRESEATKNQILKAIPDLIVWMKADGTCIDLIDGPSITNLYEKSEAVGKNLYELLPFALAQARMNAIQQALTTGDVTVYEHQVQVQGETKHEEVRVVSVGGDRILVIVRDITTRKRAEDALRQYERIVAATTDGISLIDKDYTYQVINPSYLTRFDKQRDEIIGHSVADLVGQPSFEAVIKERLDHCFAGQTVQYEAWFEYPTMGSQFMSVTYDPYIEANQTISGAVVTVRNLTELKRAETALRDSEARFRSAFHDAPIGMALISMDDRWLKVNPMLCGMLGYVEVELLALPASALVHPEDIKLLQQGVEQALSQQRNATQTALRYQCKGGRTAWGRLSLSLVRDAQNQPLYYVAQIQDVTEQQAVDQMKNEFIAIVSHELRTPLTAIKGFLGLLHTGIYADKPEKAKRMVELALSSSDRLVRLVNDILDLERLSSGKVELVMETCQADDLVQRAVEGVQSIADEAQVSLLVVPSSAQVWAAPDALIQTLTNLLSNAIKFSPAHATVTLSVQAQASSVLFQVTDQGRGIPLDKLKTIFGRFQQVDVSDARQRGGTGLGLAICQSIVQQHNGSIWVESALGQGSTFFFTVPIPDD
ncbi:MAG: PAS domain S-box protein [Tildeniella nuda ZEHNDER 1965/U140]|jgi:PAS domain S-box-containing protein|nr:PAS domain S-box protein [Tildeniella nuda ZEHNDER 1965/U140]